MKMIMESWRKFLIETSNNCSNHMVVFLAGGPGSGKSEVVKNLPLDLPIINPDKEFERKMDTEGLSLNMQGLSDYRKELRAELEGDVTPERSQEIEKEIEKISSDFSNAMKIFYAANANVDAEVDSRIKSDECSSFIIDGTGASFNRVKGRVKALQAKGYRVGMVFIDADNEQAVSRNLQRATSGGRSLPTKVVQSVYDKVQKNLSAYENLFGENFLYINNRGEFAELPSIVRSAAANHPLFI